MSPPRGSSSPGPPASRALSPRPSSGAIRGSSWSPRRRGPRPAPASTSSTRATASRSTLTELDLDRAEEIDAAIVSYPHGAAAPVVAVLRGLGAIVVDLSADFRLRDLPSYERWYGPHGDPDLLEGAVYGLPELGRDAVREAELVANPGCYPTAALLALAPLAEAGLVGDVAISAASGVSGAGRGGADFVDVAENFSPYGVDGHRHYPGDRPGAAGARARTGRSASCRTCCRSTRACWRPASSAPTRELGEEELAELYRDRYDAEPLRRRGGEAARRARRARDEPLPRPRCPPTRAAAGIIAFAAIDNLWKGAAGQAVQNLNLALGVPETEGLE